jgi:hypothetical protein
MVKQFQARVEAIQRAKAEKKEAKVLKAKGLLVQPDVLLNKVFFSDPDAEVWLLATDQTPGLLCNQHFRSEECTNRRCKWSHGMTIAHLKYNIDLEDENAESLTEPLLEYYPSVRSKLWPKIRMSPPSEVGSFSQLDDLTLVCVFDFLSDAAICAAAAACKALRIASCNSEFVNSRKRISLPRLQAARNRELLKGRNTSRLRYCGAGGELAHHWSSIHVFLHWESETDAAKTRTLDRGRSVSQDKAATVTGDTAEDDGVLGAKGTSWDVLPEAAVCALLAMSGDLEVGVISSVCAAFRRMSRLDAAVRSRRREGLSRMEAKKGMGSGKKKKKRQPKNTTGSRSRTCKY